MKTLDETVKEIDERIARNNEIIARNAIRQKEYERRQALKPRGLHAKGETRRNENFPMRVEKDFKTLLAAIAADRKQNGFRFSSMTDVVTAAVKEYALNHYPELYNEIYKQTSI